MKELTLVHVAVWSPEDQPARIKTVEDCLAQYLRKFSGSFDLMATVNQSNSRIEIWAREIVDEWAKLRPRNSVLIEHFEENMGWAWARNRAVCRFLECPEYTTLILADCDLFVPETKWLERAVALSPRVPAFMVRPLKTETRVGIERGLFGADWDIYPDWYGCINVLSRKAVEKVGGLEIDRLPRNWGFSDPELGVRLKVAGMFSGLKGFPSLAKTGVYEVHDRKYDEDFQPLKQEIIREWNQPYLELVSQVVSGERPVFVDPERDQDSVEPSASVLYEGSSASGPYTV